MNENSAVFFVLLEICIVAAELPAGIQSLNPIAHQVGLIANVVPNLSVALVATLDHVHKFRVLVPSSTFRLHILNHSCVKVEADDQVAVRYIESLFCD